MLKFFSIIFLIIGYANASQFDISSCVNGDYVEATIISSLQFQKATKTIKAIPLSHTKFYVQTDDGNKYNVVVDNVFARDFDPNNDQIPLSFKNAFTINQKVNLCGLEFAKPENGIHWVHTNCGDTQNKNPDGFVAIDGYDYTDSTNYCYLWNN